MLVNSLMKSDIYIQKKILTLTLAQYNFRLPSVIKDFRLWSLLSTLQDNFLRPRSLWFLCWGQSAVILPTETSEIFDIFLSLNFLSGSRFLLVSKSITVFYIIIQKRTLLRKYFHKYHNVYRIFCEMYSMRSAPSSWLFLNFISGMTIQSSIIHQNILCLRSYFIPRKMYVRFFHHSTANHKTNE